MRIKSFLIIFALFSVILAIFLFFFFYEYFQIKKVIIISPNKIINGLAIFNRQNIFLLNDRKISQNLVEQNPIVKSVAMKKIYPSTVMVNFSIREPIALILRESLNIFVDDEGIILPSSASGETMDLPKIELTRIPLITSQKIDWRIEKAISIIRNFSKQSIFIDQILIDGKDLNFHIILPGKIEVIVPQISEAEQIGASLQIILMRFRIEGKLVRKVDFSFEKPIVIMANEEKIYSQ